MIVKNKTKGYGYSYASLSDIVEQGYEIPKMKIETLDNADFIYYYDKELRDWVKGARIVIPESKGMNKAQLYGSALTYARRYTTLMANQLACDDDKEIENIDENGDYKDTGELATSKQLEVLEKLTDEQKENIKNHFGLSDIGLISKAQASETISKLVKRNNE